MRKIFFHRRNGIDGEAGKRLEWTLSVALLLSLLVLASYWGVQGNGFTNYDDPAYVVENRHVKEGLSGEGLVWAFTASYVSNWHPLTWLSLMLDHDLYGMNAGGYHWTSVLLHLLGVLVLFFALHRMTGDLWCSGLVAGLFGVHPLHVESVAWVSERKDVLSGLFWMLGLWGYAWYAERPGWGRYGAVVLFFVLGLLSKPMVVTFPFVLLLLDWWPLGRLGRASWRSLASLAYEKIPLFVLSAASSVVTFMVQREGGAVAPFGHLPLDHRISNAALSYVEYLAKMLLPLNLSIFYPYLGPPSAGRLIAVVFILLAITAAAVIGARRLPYLPVGWFWYLGTLVPVIGLVQVGSQSMADRYSYLPLIGIFIVLAWGLNDLLRTRPHRRVLFALISGLILSGLVILTQAQAGFWKESVTLFAQAIRNTDRNYYAHHTLAMALSQKGDFPGAESQYREALRFKPSFPEAQGGLGYVLMIQGRYEVAVGHFESALRVKPGYQPALRYFGDLRMRQQRVDDALALYRKALLEGKEDYELFNNYGVALFCRGEREEALRNIREALRIKPDYAEARENLRKISDHGEGR